MAATEKQKGFIIVLAKKRGYQARDYIDARLGRAMGLSMRERSGAGLLTDFVERLDKREASDIISALLGGGS